MLDDIPAVLVSENENHFTNFAPGCKAALFVHEHNEVHGFSDKSLLRRCYRFGDETFQANEAADRIIGVNRCDAAGMPGIPRFQQSVRLRTSNLSDDNACWL